MMNRPCRTPDRRPEDETNMDTTDPLALYQRIDERIRGMEEKLTSALSSGLAALNLAITSLGDRMNAALLDQERRNATFTTQERHDQLVRRVDEIGSRLTTADTHLSQLIASQQKHDDRGFDLSLKTREWIILTGLMLLSVALTTLLAHLAG